MNPGAARRGLPRALDWIACALLAASLAACGKRADPPDPAAVAASAAAASRAEADMLAARELHVLASSEVRDIEPALQKAAAAAGVTLKLSYAGTLDIVERVNGGEAVDALLPANGAYPNLALTRKPLAQDKLFYSRVALGVKQAKANALGWDQQTPSWAEIARAAGAGQLRYAMTNPTSSNTGMSALFAVASAAAGKTEDLKAEEVDAKLLTAFLSGQKLSSGSSGWLAEAFIKDPSALDGMVNYEAVILRSNEKLAPADRLRLIYPKDGVISADYPLMLVEPAKREPYNALVAAIKGAVVQNAVASEAFLRPSLPEVALAAGLSSAAVAELSFPNRLEVIDAVLSAYQGEWRRPATSIFVLDISGSMAGERIAAMRGALKFLAGNGGTGASARYASFQRRERVVLIAFSELVEDPVEIDFETQSLDAGRARVTAYADALHVKGGTGIYAALLRAEAIAAQERLRDSERYLSIVLLTDGENTAGPDLAGFRSTLANGAPARVFPILFGESNSAEMDRLASFTGGRAFDGRKAALAQVFKEIRGYQ